MSLKRFSKQKDIENSKDTLGGFSPLESGVYDASIKLAYLSQAKSGAEAVNLILNLAGREYRETVYVTNRNGEVFYTRNGIKSYLPGFSLIDELCQITLGKAIGECDTETKKVKLYNFETNQEEPTDVEVLIELLNQKVKVGIQQVQEFKQTKNDEGVYEDTDEVLTKNIINKFFSTEGFTANELSEEADEAEFIVKWEERNKGHTIDRTKGKKPAVASRGKPKKQATKNKPSSLFQDEPEEDDIPF